MVDVPQWSRAEVWRNTVICAVVVAAHLGLFAVLARPQSVAPIAAVPPFDVVLFRPDPPPPPEPVPAREVGGGAPLAPSRVRPAPSPPPAPPEVVAPPAPAPEPARVVGASPEPGAAPARAQGGTGTGSGAGSGAGVGPGSGTTRARLIRAASVEDLRRLHPPTARGRSGRVAVTCRIRLDTRLDACRVASEAPSGQGFGAAGLAAAGLYRFQPPAVDGRPIAGEITVIVEFGRPAR